MLIHDDLGKAVQFLIKALTFLKCSCYERKAARLESPPPDCYTDILYLYSTRGPFETRVTCKATKSLSPLNE
jgi:hypothetical protein